MRQKVLFTIVMLIFLMVLGLAACGNTDSSSSTTTISTIEQKADEEKVPEPDTKTFISADTLLGEWNDVNDAKRFVEITKDGDNYQYKDNEGTYPGTYKDNVLTIKVSNAKNDTAIVFVDAKTNNLVTKYQGNIFKFTRKQQ